MGRFIHARHVSLKQIASNSSYCYEKRSPLADNSFLVVASHLTMRGKRTHKGDAEVGLKRPSRIDECPLPSQDLSQIAGPGLRGARQ